MTTCTQHTFLFKQMRREIEEDAEESQTTKSQGESDNCILGDAYTKYFETSPQMRVHSSQRRQADRILKPSRTDLRPGERDETVTIPTQLVDRRRGHSRTSWVSFYTGMQAICTNLGIRNTLRKIFPKSVFYGAKTLSRRNGHQT